MSGTSPRPGRSWVCESDPRCIRPEHRGPHFYRECATAGCTSHARREEPMCPRHEDRATYEKYQEES